MLAILLHGAMVHRACNPGQVMGDAGQYVGTPLNLALCPHACIPPPCLQSSYMVQWSIVHANLGRLWETWANTSAPPSAVAVASASSALPTAQPPQPPPPPKHPLPTARSASLHCIRPISCLVHGVAFGITSVCLFYDARLDMLLGQAVYLFCDARLDVLLGQAVCLFCGARLDMLLGQAVCLFCGARLDVTSGSPTRPPSTSMSQEAYLFKCPDHPLFLCVCVCCLLQDLRPSDKNTQHKHSIKGPMGVALTPAALGPWESPHQRGAINHSPGLRGGSKHHAQQDNYHHPQNNRNQAQRPHPPPSPPQRQQQWRHAAPVAQAPQRRRLDGDLAALLI
eukprot:1141483-Pelagomonas_calceolata.AAC.1